MRLSLSVPDALWLRARETYPIFGDSRLVQAAIECMIADSRPNYLEGPPPEAADRIRRLQTRLTSEARSAFNAGYDSGLALAEVVDWSILEQLAAAHWRLDDLLNAPRPGGLADSMRALLVERNDQPTAQFIAELERCKSARKDADLRRVATFASGLLLALRQCFEAGDVAMVADDVEDVVSR